MDYLCKYSSPLGEITMKSDGKALTGLWFEKHRYADIPGEGEYEEKELPVFEETKRWLDAYFDGRDPGFTPEIAYDVSDFAAMVMEEMLKIPYGKTVTYGDIAGRISERTGKKPCAQAVGGAVGHNPISLVVPCHRVVGRSGSLTGYGGGIDRKVALLKLEKTDMSGMFVPKKGTAL